MASNLSRKRNERGDEDDGDDMTAHRVKRHKTSTANKSSDQAARESALEQLQRNFPKLSENTIRLIYTAGGSHFEAAHSNLQQLADERRHSQSSTNNSTLPRDSTSSSNKTNQAPPSSRTRSMNTRLDFLAPHTQARYTADSRPRISSPLNPNRSNTTIDTSRLAKARSPPASYMGQFREQSTPAEAPVQATRATTTSRIRTPLPDHRSSTSAEEHARVPLNVNHHDESPDHSDRRALVLQIGTSKTSQSDASSPARISPSMIPPPYVMPTEFVQNSAYVSPYDRVPSKPQPIHGPFITRSQRDGDDYWPTSAHTPSPTSSASSAEPSTTSSPPPMPSKLNSQWVASVSSLSSSPSIDNRSVLEAKALLDALNVLQK